MSYLNSEAVKISTIFRDNEIYDTLCALSENLFNQSINTPCTLQSLAKKYAQNANVIVAYVNDVPKGLCVFYDNNNVTKIAFLSMIVVAKEEQGKGIGNLLIKSMIKHCVSNGMERLELEVANANVSAIRFYEKNGFKIEKAIGDKRIYYHRFYKQEI